MERIASPSRTREIVEKNGFYFKKNFGQNFLIDSNILEGIVSDAGVTSEDCVLEIGPGIGSLTQVLAENAHHVISVEIDKNLIPILKETLCSYENIEIINQDVLKLDLKQLLEEKAQGRRVKVVANLPYYITTPIIMGLLENRAPVESITIMVQKEVAERMQAQPGDKEYGALSLAVQYYAHTNMDRIVPPSCFMPRPKVASAVITLKLYQEPAVSVSEEAFLFEVIRCAFGQRRKTLLNCLYNTGGFGLSKEELTNLLVDMGWDARIRGEALSLAQFAELAERLIEKRG